MTELGGGVARVVDFAEAARRLGIGQSRPATATPPLGVVPAKVGRSPQSESDYIDEILRFRCALANLAANNGDPADLIRYMDPLFGDALVIREHLHHAVRWINQFAKEWDREQTTHGSQGQIQQGSE